ncbi:cell wall hydrolase [Sphingomonas sp. 3-13AW]|jgi:spore germination cell wall hydrolase CwlJ-like protein|uniref:cell wall hydrolase n=1 Tax=Sphingomonas sp. 3-13AW TaxID=3050450 RepID=UPI003BB48FC3
MLLLDPQHVSALPPRRRHGVALLLAALAGLLIVGSIAFAVVSLRQGPGESTAMPATARELGEARIEAPFAPATLRPLSRQQAIAWNAAAPAPASASEAASTFLLRTGKASDFQRSLECLTMALYYEAGNETDDGQRAVAQVILNRVRHPAYPKTVCGVVLDGAERRTGCQFTFVCDGSRARTPSRQGWLRSRAVAAAALGGAVFAPVGWATHYHANYVVPYWAASLDKVAIIGPHIFYRWSGRAGRSQAFRGVYAGNEPALPLQPVAAAPTRGTGATETRSAGAVPPTERPVLTGPRVGESAASVGLGERRVLSHAPVVGEPPAFPERHALPGSPRSAD